MLSNNFPISLHKNTLWISVVDHLSKVSHIYIGCMNGVLISSSWGVPGNGILPLVLFIAKIINFKQLKSNKEVLWKAHLLFYIESHMLDPEY
jgi:hypothetical protein